MSYYVYFDASSNNCSGWLDVNNSDLAVNAHFMEWATEFKTKEEALQAANERLAKIYAMCDEIENDEKERCKKNYCQMTYNAEENKKRYKFWILEMIEDGNNKV